jgi:hypothetical protein
MSDKPRIAIDLNRLAGALPAEHAALVGKIRRCRDSHSVHTDLMHASDMIGSVEAAFGAAQSGVGWAQHAVPALVYSAIILYARATHSDSKHRVRINLTKHFTPAQKALHDRIVTLRNDALAHYGPGEISEGFAYNLMSCLGAAGATREASASKAAQYLASSGSPINFKASVLEKKYPDEWKRIEADRKSYFAEPGNEALLSEWQQIRQLLPEADDDRKGNRRD